MVKLRSDYPGAYGSFQVFNAWGSSLPWGHHMANGSFEITSSAGNSYFVPASFEEPVPPQIGGQGETARYTYFVISKEDPGVHNWIGTMGHRPIYLAGRLQSVLDPVDVAIVSGVGPWMPIGYTVPLAAIFPGSPALPPDTVFVSPEQRADQIPERRVYQQAKYAPWQVDRSDRVTPWRVPSDGRGRPFVSATPGRGQARPEMRSWIDSRNTRLRLKRPCAAGSSALPSRVE